MRNVLLALIYVMAMLNVVLYAAIAGNIFHSHQMSQVTQPTKSQQSSYKPQPVWI